MALLGNTKLLQPTTPLHNALLTHYMMVELTYCLMEVSSAMGLQMAQYFQKIYIFIMRLHSVLHWAYAFTTPDVGEGGG